MNWTGTSGNKRQRAKAATLFCASWNHQKKNREIHQIFPLSWPYDDQVYVPNNNRQDRLHMRTPFTSLLGVKSCTISVINKNPRMLLIRHWDMPPPPKKEKKLQKKTMRKLIIKKNGLDRKQAAHRNYLQPKGLSPKFINSIEVMEIHIIIEHS